MDTQLMRAVLGGMWCATLDKPFGPETAVYKVGGKMYALVSLDPMLPRVTLKAKPEDVAARLEAYPSVEPGYYMNKRHWISLWLDGSIPDETLRKWAHESYALVVDTLPKKSVVALGLRTGKASL